jgi:hypothetical protein
MLIVLRCSWRRKGKGEKEKEKFLCVDYILNQARDVEPGEVS